MIHRLNEQVLGSSDSDVNTARNKQVVQRRSSSKSASLPAQSNKESPATSSLRNLVEENAKANPVQVASDPTNRHNNTPGRDEDVHDDSSLEDASMAEDSKRPAVPSSSLPQQLTPAKRPRPSVL